MFSKRTTPLDYIDGRIMKIDGNEIDRFQRESYKKYNGINFRDN